jgi:formylglycine-generating enzyme required for sulfatase activity
MKQMYFSHPAYNDYPVVNISREGAEMYCIWLSIAVNEALREKGKALMNDLRLPSEYEWGYAASNKANQVRYANGTPELRNSRGLYLQNYNGDTYANSRYDSIHDVYLFHKTEDGKGPVTDGGFFTTVTGAYAPNLYGIYDLAGNVSEMVYLWDGKSNKARGFGTKGGSWCSPDYFLEIDARQEFKHPEKPSPLVGFRPVMTADKPGR